MGFFRWLFGARRNLTKAHAELGVFAEALRAKGWTEITAGWEYAKGDWKIDFDTGHWMIVSTKSNPRVFDVSAPTDHESRWTVNLIDHLCRMEDERHRFRKALERIRDNPNSDQEARSTAREALEQCYHSWLALDRRIPENQMSRYSCPICDQTKCLGDIQADAAEWLDGRHAEPL